MNKYYYDIECLKEIFCVSFLKYNTENEWVVFEISERKNELHDLISFLQNSKLFLIGFNNQHYDNRMLNYILLNDKLHNVQLKNILELTQDLRNFSDLIIHQENIDYQSPYYKCKYEYLDLFLNWSKNYRLSKRISLKSCGINVNHNTVKDMTNLNSFDDLLYYNKNDVIITKKLCDYLRNDINLKQKISLQINHNCLNYDNITTASKVLAKKLSETNNWNLSFYETYKLHFTQEKYKISEFIHPFTIKYNYDIFQNLYDRILNQKSVSETLIVNINNTSIQLTFGNGGLHSVNEWEQHYTDDDYLIITSDVSSLYPALIINYDCLRFSNLLKIYTEMRDNRIIAKRNKNISESDFLKLCLNGVSGLLDNQYSWLYYPEGALRMRLAGQLILTKFIEVCIENNWQVISVNTDGIEVKILKNDYLHYINILNECAKSFNLELEHDIYKSIHYQNINSYVAFTQSNKIKQKGEFLENPPITDSRDYLIISKALNNYFQNKTSIKDFITNHNNIYDFCSSQKTSKDHEVYHNKIKQQRLNRYYASKKGAFLYKVKEKKTTHMNKESAVLLANNVDEQVIMSDYNIDYQYYIRETQKYIDKFNMKINQLKLF